MSNVIQLFGKSPEKSPELYQSIGRHPSNGLSQVDGSLRITQDSIDTGIAMPMTPKTGTVYCSVVVDANNPFPMPGDETPASRSTFLEER